MNLLPLLVLLLSCRTQAVRSEVMLSPVSLTVVRGNEAKFSCSTSRSEWTVMVWLLNGRVMQTISKENGVLLSINPNMTAVKCPNSKKDCWVFVLKSTERNNEGNVTCDLQQIESRTAKLFVQEKGSVRVSGENRLAFKGDSVLFQCQAAGWYPQPVLQWQVNNNKVSQGEYNISTELTERRLFTVSSNLSFTAERSSPVDCLASVSALKTPLKNTVSLTVVSEVLAEEEDCTVLVGVTAALSALLLLVLLSICTVLCYRQRRKPKNNPQEVIRFDQSVFGRSPVAEATGGKVNLGYSSEEPTDVESSEVIIGSQNQMGYDTIYKVPDVVHSSTVSLHIQSQTTEFQEEENFSNIRRVTTV